MLRKNNLYLGKGCEVNNLGDIGKAQFEALKNDIFILNKNPKLHQPESIMVYVF